MIDQREARSAGNYLLVVIVIFAGAVACGINAFDGDGGSQQVATPIPESTPDCSKKHYRLNIDGLYYDYDPKTASVTQLYLSDDQLRDQLESGGGCPSITFPGSDGKYYQGQPIEP